MKTTIRRILAAAVSAVMMTGFAAVGAYAAELSYRDLNGVTWSYAGNGDTALESIRDSGQTIEQAQALLIPAGVDGTPVAMSWWGTKPTNTSCFPRVSGKLAA